MLRDDVITEFEGFQFPARLRRVHEVDCVGESLDLTELNAAVSGLLPKGVVLLPKGVVLLPESVVLVVVYGGGRRLLWGLKEFLNEEKW
ncbi:hypothetical protein HanRHA438_Chr15g0702541 [Helianthus annuus]|nr:hypothetical protein HanIR_Chr15g0750011 [Helianthus annuus]KAJ0844443.1 hypothetical protein HanRHA438_Chr15g0702541 [Helianthus annuus]